MTDPHADPVETPVTIRVDGEPVSVADGDTLLDACRSAGIDTPTICYGRQPHPGQRLPGVRGRGRGLPHAGAGLLRGRPRTAWSSTPTPSGCATAAGWCWSSWARRSTSARPPSWPAGSTDYGADPTASATAVPGRRGAEGPGRPVRAGLRAVRPLLQVRRGLRRRRPAHLRHRRGRAGVRGPDLHRVRRRAARVGLRLLRQLHRGVSRPAHCSSRPSSSFGPTGTWRPDEQTVTTTVCSYCGVGCNLELHVQDDEIVKVTSPDDHDVTRGNLCIKGRFGWRYV